MAETALSMGVTLHPWQRHVADVSLELVSRKGRRKAASRLRLGARSVGVMVGRQTGKTTWAAARIGLQASLPDRPDVAALVGLDRIRPQHIAFTAQDRTAALKRFDEHVEMIMAGDLAGSVAKVVRQRGDEALKFRNGSVYSVLTPSRTGARGASLDLAIIDEALAHDVSLLAAVRPTMAQRDGAAGCVGAQLVLVSNAGDERATLLNGERELGRRAVLDGDRSRCWLEWSAPDDCDPYDETVWRSTIPTFDQPNGIDPEFLRLEAESMDPSTFRREYLSSHVNRPEATLIADAAWQAAPLLEIGTRAAVRFAVDSTISGDAACIAVAGPTDDGSEHVAVEVYDHEPGVDWVVPRVVAVCARWGAAVVVDSLGPLAWTIPMLERAGVDVHEARTGDLVAAASGFTSAVASGRIAHQHDPRLGSAIAAARARRTGDRWMFDRHVPVDVSPLIAASLAVWAVDELAEPAVFGGALASGVTQ